MTQPAILLYADSERSADMLYLGRIQVPDAFVAFVARGKKYAVLGALELGRARKESAFDKILPLETYLQRARKRWPDRKPGPAEVVALVAAEFRVKNFYIPDDFPAGLATRISQLGVGLTIVTDAIFPEREVKTRTRDRRHPRGQPLQRRRPRRRRAPAPRQQGQGPPAPPRGQAPHQRAPPPHH